MISYTHGVDPDVMAYTSGEQEDEEIIAEANFRPRFPDQKPENDQQLRFPLAVTKYNAKSKRQCNLSGSEKCELVNNVFKFIRNNKNFTVTDRWALCKCNSCCCKSKQDKVTYKITRCYTCVECE